MIVVNYDPHGRRRRHRKLARSVSMAGGSCSDSVLEEEVTTASLFLDLDGDQSGLAVASHGEQSWHGGEQSRALVGWHEGEGNARRVLLRATHEQVRTSPRGAVATCGIWSPLHHRTRCHACAHERSVQPI
jgi:hypothetical protein